MLYRGTQENTEKRIDKLSENLGQITNESQTQINQLEGRLIEAFTKLLDGKQGQKQTKEE